VNLDDTNPISEIIKAVRLHRQLADQAKAGLETALPVLRGFASGHLRAGSGGDRFRKGVGCTFLA